MFVLRTQGVGWTKISVVTGGNYGKECLIHQVAGVRYIIRRKHSDVGYEDIMNRQSLESIGHLSWRQLGNVTEARDREDTRTQADSRYITEIYGDSTSANESSTRNDIAAKQHLDETHDATPHHHIWKFTCIIVTYPRSTIWLFYPYSFTEINVVTQWRPIILRE